MNTVLRWTLPILALVAISEQSVYSQEHDVLLKDGFEQGESAPDGWKQGANIPGVKYVYDKKRGKTGERSLSLQKSANRYFPIAQWFRVVPHSGKAPALRVTGQVRAEKAFKAIIDLQFLKQNGEGISHEWVSYIGAKEAGDPPATHDWKEYSGEVAIPEGTGKISIALQMYGPGKVWFDDLEVVYSEQNPDDPQAAAPKPIEIQVGEAKGEYLFAPPQEESKTANGLLIVLPGGAGTANFHPFVRRIHENCLSKDFAVAQPLAKKWTNDQFVVWPTASSRTEAAKFTTEELVEAVIEHVGKTTKLDPERIYLLAWSSGGPAAYATLLQKETAISGAFIAMSVFKPDQYPDASNAKGRRVYLLHSPEDRVCPYRMAASAKEALTKADVKTTLVDYNGGHGWRGDVFGMIRAGVAWLERRSD
jgi:predicted esterase